MRQFTGHTNWGFGADFSADGIQIISGSRDQSLMLWDVATGDMQHVFLGEAGGAPSVMFVPNSQQVISAHSTGFLRVWNASDRV